MEEEDNPMARGGDIHVFAPSTDGSLFWWWGFGVFLLSHTLSLPLILMILGGLPRLGRGRRGLLVRKGLVGWLGWLMGLMGLMSWTKRIGMS